MTRFFGGFLFLFLFLGFADAESYDSIENLQTADSQAKYLSQLLIDGDDSSESSSDPKPSHYFVVADLFSGFSKSLIPNFYNDYQLGFNPGIFSPALYARGPPPALS